MLKYYRKTTFKLLKKCGPEMALFVYILSWDYGKVVKYDDGDAPIIDQHAMCTIHFCLH